MSAPETTAALIARATGQLAAAGVPSPRHDAEELAAHCLGVERRELWRHTDLDPTAHDAYAELIGRRAAREPLQHLTGKAHFRWLTLVVGPGVFVPRPETEVVAQAAIDEALRISGTGGTPVVVDLGTGSGAIALAVATEVPGSRVHAVELDPRAHAWAERNLAEAPVELRFGGMVSAFPELDGTVDVVVSNPPYIPEGARIRDPEVAVHDPALALWSGVDGLDAVREVALTARRLLRPGGLVVIEHADLQGESAPAVLTAAGGFTELADHRDLAGRPRYVTARLSTIGA